MLKARVNTPASHALFEPLEPRLLLSGYIKVLMASSIYEHVLPWAEMYEADLEAEGYAVDVARCMEISADGLRSSLAQTWQDHSDFQGAVLVGDLPTPVFEIENDYDPEDQFGYAAFPCDLYYMDLDGTWKDTDHDGRFDDHPNDGNQCPDIWVSRVTPGRAGSVVDLARAYFRKLHNYRTGQISFEDQGLLYIDDDWASSADGWSQAVGKIYSSVSTISDESTTTAEHFRQTLSSTNVEWMHTAIHSSATSMSFGPTGDSSEGALSASEISALNPRIGFFDWFQCSFADYTVDGYGAGEYIFDTDYGLVGVGSTKTGSMVHNVGIFYESLSNGESMGRAFKEWLCDIGSDGYSSSETSWEFGMALIGDGALGPKHPQNSNGLGYLPIDTLLGDGTAQVANVSLVQLAISSDTP